jgi:hypothetical protein
MPTLEEISFPEGKEVALAAAKKAGKPLLTADALTTLGKNQEGIKALAAEAAKDVPAFVRKHFYLTVAQEKYLGRIPTAKLAQLTTSLQNVAKEGGTVNVSSELVAGTGGAGPIATAAKHVKVSVTTPVGSIVIEIDKP